MVEAEGLRKSFGEVHALRGVDLAVPEGTICALLGPNGAGKTTAVRILATLTGRENLLILALMLHLGRRRASARAAELLERFGLADAGGRLVKTWSGGMRRRLDLVASLIVAPAVLFLDEPTTGLDPRSRAEIWSAVRSLATDGTTILLTTQYLEEADRLAGQIVILD